MADIETVRIIKIETEGSERTVKDLRNEIKSLRDDLVNVDKGTEQYDEIVKKLISDEQKLTDVMRAGKNEVSAATGSYNALQNELTSLRKVWKEVTDETQRAEIGKRIAELNTELKNMDASIGNFQRQVGNYENAIRKVTAEYTSQRSELKALRVELEQLEPGTEAYNKAFTRAAEITHNITEQQEILKYGVADLGDQLSNIRGIATNMVAGFSAVNAAMGLFGAESEDVQKAMLKVQQSIALVQGLEGLDGFIKRTQGLSTALKTWIAQSKTATVQTTAQATATKAAATATNAETVATEGATVAQKGLNAAIKANPIGFLLGLLALLIANWKKVTEWIGKAVGGFDKFNKIVNKTKQVLSGVANVIGKGLLVPVKEAINYVATLGKVLKDVFTLNWDNIGKDIKDGIGKSVDIVKDGFDVATNYAEGKENEITRQQEKEIKERAIQRASELEDIIAENDAKYGSDWKYTEEAKKLYDELFDKRMLQYKKDSKEYKEAQNDKLIYDREFTEHQEKAKEEAQKKAAENAKKQVEAAKKAQEELKKIESDYQSKVSSKVGSSYAASFYELKESLSAFSAYYKSISGSLSSSNSKALKTWAKSIDDFLNNSATKIKVFANETASMLFGLSKDEILNSGILSKDYIDKYFKDSLGNLLPENEIKKTWKRIVDKMTEITDEGVSSGLSDAIQMRMDIELRRLQKLSGAKLNDALENSSDEVSRKINDEIIKIFQKNIKPTVDEQIADLQFEIGKKTIKLDFEIETGMDFNSFMGSGVFNPIEGFDKQAAELEKAAEVYKNSLKQVNVQLDFYQKTIEHVNEHPELIPSDEYENALKMVEQLTNQAQQLYVDYYNTNAEIRDRYFAEDIQRIQAHAANEERLVELNYNKKYAGEGKWKEWYLNGRRELSGTIMKYDIQAAEETYQIQKNSLEEQLTMYQSYLSDVTVAGEQRVEAEKMVAELIAEIEEGEVAHTREMNELRIQSFQGWFNYAQEAINGVGDLLGGLADYYEADIKAKQANNEISEEQAYEMYENVKKLKISEVIISTISGAIGAFMQAVSAYPAPWGEILGGVSAAAVTAAGMAQVAQIKQQQLGSGGGSVKAVATPQVQSFTPEYVENPTGDSELTNLRNSMYEQPIRAFVVESDITDAQKTANTRREESSF